MTTPIRIAAVASSPVFYQVPLYQRLAADPRVDLTVLYSSSAGVRPYDADFGTDVAWDVDLLGGYRSEFLAAADRNEVLGGFFALADRDIFWRILRGRFDVVWVHGFSYVTIWLAMAAAFLRRRPILLREEQTLLRRRTGAKRIIRAGVLRSLFAGIHGLYIGSNNRATSRATACRTSDCSSRRTAWTTTACAARRARSLRGAPSSAARSAWRRTVPCFSSSESSRR